MHPIQTATWGGLTPLIPLSSPAGPFTVTDALDPQADSASFIIAASPGSPSTGATQSPSGLPSSSTTATPSIAPIDAVVSTDHTVYKPGQSVRITMTLKAVQHDKKGDGAAKVALTRNPAGDGFMVMEGSTVVCASPRDEDVLKAHPSDRGK